MQLFSFNGSIIWAQFINLTPVCWCLWFPAGNIVWVQTAHTQIRSVFVFWKHNFPVGSSAAIAYQPTQSLLQLHLHWQGVCVHECVFQCTHPHHVHLHTTPALSCRWSHNHNTEWTHTHSSFFCVDGSPHLMSPVSHLSIHPPSFWSVPPKVA